jgi:hypothetical protein
MARLRTIRTVLVPDRARGLDLAVLVAAVRLLDRVAAARRADLAEPIAPAVPVALLLEDPVDPAVARLLVRVAVVRLLDRVAAARRADLAEPIVPTVPVALLLEDPVDPTVLDLVDLVGLHRVALGLHRVAPMAATARAVPVDLASPARGAPADRADPVVHHPAVPADLRLPADPMAPVVLRRRALPVVPRRRPMFSGVTTTEAVPGGVVRTTPRTASARPTTALRHRPRRAGSAGTVVHLPALLRRTGTARHLPVAGTGPRPPAAGTRNGAGQPVTLRLRKPISGRSATTATTPFRFSTRYSADGVSGSSVRGFRCTDLTALAGAGFR